MIKNRICISSNRIFRKFIRHFIIEQIIEKLGVFVFVNECEKLKNDFARIDFPFMLLNVILILAIYSQHGCIKAKLV